MDTLSIGGYDFGLDSKGLFKYPWERKGFLPPTACSLAKFTGYLCICLPGLFLAFDHTDLCIFFTLRSVLIW